MTPPPSPAGEDQLEANRRAVLDAVSDARRDGFAVGEDYTVTDRSTGGSRQQRAARLGQAQGHADFIRHRVGALLATDRDIATRVSAATQGLDELAFEDVPGVDTPAEDGVQAVDFRQAPPPGAPGACPPATSTRSTRPIAPCCKTCWRSTAGCPTGR